MLLVLASPMEGLAFLPVPDLTIGIHLLRTLCPDDPPEAADVRSKWLVETGGLRVKTRRTA
jgi:flagella basal body P-ring formation protein FlgA